MHSDYSDGLNDPATLLENVRKAGLDVFSLTDHDSVRGCAEMRTLLKEGDPYFINGIEFSCEDKLGCYHILGYGYSFTKPGVNGAAEIAHRGRVKKAKERFIFLKERFGFTFTEEEMTEIFNEKNPGKPHYARMMAKKGIVPDENSAFYYLNQFKSSVPKFTPEEAITAILNSDGVPVLAHAFFGDGDQVLTEEEVEARVVRFKNEYGLMGLECYYASFTEEMVQFMLHLADKYKLLVSTGSDYHGKGSHNTYIGNTNNPDVERVGKLINAISLLSADNDE